MDSRIKLSILVPAFNMERYLAQCLDSILMQQVNFKYQVLLGEDFSTDSTKEIAAQFQARYPDIIKVFYNDKNLGASGSLCRLIELVDTEFFIQIDGDDYITDKAKLQIQFDTLSANPACAMCYHNYSIVDSEGQNPKLHIPPFPDSLIIPKNYLLHRDLGPGNLVMVRRSALPKVLPNWLHHCGYQVDYLVHCLAAAEGGIYYIDKAMRKQVGKPLKKAETLVKKAEKANSKLADYDERVRDPQIEKLHKLEKKKCHSSNIKSR